MAAGLITLALLFAGCAEGASGEQGSESPEIPELTPSRSDPTEPATADPPAATTGSPSASPSAAPSGSAPDRATPSVLTDQDTGETVALRTGDSVALRLSSDLVWESPDVDGAAVTLTPVDYFTDPGFQEWIVTGVAAGEATVRTAGTATDGSRAMLEIVFIVR